MVLPTGASYNDLTKKITLVPSKVLAAGNNIIGEVQYYYADNYVGCADIIYQSENQVIVVPSPTPTPTVTPNGSPTEDSQETSSNLETDSEKNDNRPLIIGIIVGVVVLAAGLYIVLVELPYRKKKKAYQKKYGRN